MSFIYDSMRPYQREGAHWLRRAGSALLADQPGLGKTIQTLGTIIAETSMREKAGEPARQQWCLVLTPSVAVNNVWGPEVRRWLADHDVAVLTLGSNLSLTQRSSALHAFRPKAKYVFVVTNIESMRIKPVEDTLPGSRRDVIRFKKNVKGYSTKMVYAPENAMIPGLLDRSWDMVVCDESQRALIRTSGTPTQVRAGFTLVEARRRIALSGTPMRGKPEQLWGTLNWLYPHEFTSYWRWVKDYFVLSSNGFSNYVLGGYLPDGEKRLGEDLQQIMLRRTKSEVLADLPPKMYAGEYAIEGDEYSPIGVWLDPTPKQRKQYEQFEAEAVVTTEKGEGFANGVLAQYTRRRQLAGAAYDIESGEFDEATWTPTLDSNKYEWILNWLQNSDEKIVIVSQYTSLIDAFAAGLKAEGYKVATLTGNTSEKARERAVDGFQNGDLQVFMLNTKAGGVALTLDAADYLVFLDETTVPDDQEQAEDRIHRASRMHNVTIYKLLTKNTIEEEVAFVAAARENVTRYLLDGARGVEYAKRLYAESRKSA